MAFTPAFFSRPLLRRAREYGPKEEKKERGERKGEIPRP